VIKTSKSFRTTDDAIDGTAPQKADDSTAVLAVSGLTIDSPTPLCDPVRLVDGVNLTLGRGERLALVGESGSGKSVTARAILGLDPELVLGGSVSLVGTELVGAAPRTMQAVRGSRIGMVFQDPMHALNPLQTIGAQVAEPLLIRGVRKREALAKAANLLEELGVARARERLKSYPHEFSGGMRQRVVLAIALICEPEILIADEPTTALDVMVQRQVLSILERACRDRGIGLLLITHDLGVVAGIAERVAVMYSGRIVEEGSAETVFAKPVHPYTTGLLAAVPRMDRTVDRMVTIAGTTPLPADRPGGCPFHPRCPVAVSRCRTERPVPAIASNGNLAECHLADAVQEDQR
jgi:oligopeptide/dipeptide ABC transporter ATP-binding protein